MKLYLITGAAGFIGSQFVNSCFQKKISVLSVDEEIYFKTRPQHQGIHFGEILDRNRVFNQSLPKNIDAIIHLGAITDTSQKDEAIFNLWNLHYSQKLWQLATDQKIPFIYASSAATYGKGEKGYDDNESLIPQLKPLNPYGESKQRFDLWALQEERKGNHPPFWAGFKFFNVYGLGEQHKGFMASVVFHAFQQILESKQVKLFKSHRPDIQDGFQKRDFIWVQDVVKALHFAVEKPIQRGIFNLGTGQARTFLDLAHGVFQSLNYPKRIEWIETPLSVRDSYQYQTEAPMQKLQKEGYNTAFTCLEVGIQKYVEQLQKVR